MQHYVRKRSLLYLGIIILALLILSASLAVRIGRVQRVGAASVDLGHQSLSANDGWAASNGGTSGGSTATSANVYAVSSRAQLVQALGGNKGTDTTPKIIYIQGNIYGNQDDSGNTLTCSSYTTGGYSLAAYLKAYDPAVWGRTKVPSGTQESARAASEKNQGARVQIYIPSNTTIIGNAGVSIIGANFMVKGVTNVIIRNLDFQNASDCFPQWDPTDGSSGNWNSAFDNISIYGATHVWIDHNTFTDGSQPDSSEPNYFGRIYEQHDGECDITKEADLVTVSWNIFSNHDKTMLIGSSDSYTADTGKLRVTIHHNEFLNTVEREPRVRFGEVHVYDNYYNETANSQFQYALGVGISSAIYAQNNDYQLPSGFSAADIIQVYKGTMLYSTGDIVNGKSVDILAAYNAANSSKLSSNVGWTPQYHLALDPTTNVQSLVQSSAGAGQLGSGGNQTPTPTTPPSTPTPTPPSATPTPTPPSVTPTPTQPPTGFTPTPGTHYHIVNRNSSQVLEITGWSTANGGRAEQWTNTSGANQEWSFVATNGGYKIVNVNSGLLLDDPGGSKTTGTQLDQWNDSNGSNQWWNLVSDGGGYYSIVNQSSGLDADVSGASTIAGAAVIEWTGTGGNNQEWSFVAV